MKKIYLLFLSAAFLATGCTKDDSPERVIINDSPICFMPSLGDVQNMTRASQVTKATLTSFSVSAAAYPKTQSYTTNPCGNFFHDLTVSTASGYTGYYWPTDNYVMSFYAYAPASSDVVNVGLASEIGKPTYTVAIPANISRQVDFLTAEVLDMAPATGPIALTFSHRFADIRVVARNSGIVTMTLKSVSLYGMTHNGTYKAGVWTPTGDANSRSTNAFVLSPNSSIASGASLDVTGEDSHVMIIPQTITSGTEIMDILVNIEGTDRHYYYTLDSNMTLSEGQSYTFTLLMGYDGVTVTVNAEDWAISPYYQPAAQDWTTFEALYGITVARQFQSGFGIHPDGDDWQENGQSTTVDINGWD